jgi:hypothetical protein
LQTEALFSTTSDGSTSRKINYPGTGNYSTFSYDAEDSNSEIEEFSSGSSTSTKLFVSWYPSDEPHLDLALKVRHDQEQSERESSKSCTHDVRTVAQRGSRAR